MRAVHRHRAPRLIATFAAALMLLPGVLPLHAQEQAAADRPATAASPAPEAKAAANGPKAPSPPKSLAAWRGKVIAHLNGARHDVAGANGTATVAFKIDRGGKVISAQVLTSSGNASLDAEAVALPQRASPVPAPPADVAGDTLFLKVPIRFKR